MSLTDTIDLLYGNPMHVIANCMRSFICAAPGNELVVADFNAIEARGVAWLAGEQKVLDVFRTGADIYCHAASAIYGREISKKKDPDERQIGKVATLALGYQGGVGAFQTMARGYGVKVADEQADDIKKKWRAAHENIVQYWWDLEDAAIRAVANPGLVTVAGHPGRQIKFLKKGSFLLARLPSGRRLAYPYACLKDVEMPWRDRDGNKVFKPQVHYMTVDSVTKAWGETSTYGGKLCENVTQAVCRDILAEAIKRAELMGYPVIMHVHDEIVSEVPEGFGSVEDFEALLCEPPAWATGFPIAAEGWRGKRYRK